jgi:hypothetical protein
MTRATFLGLSRSHITAPRRGHDIPRQALVCIRLPAVTHPDGCADEWALEAAILFIECPQPRLRFRSRAFEYSMQFFAGPHSATRAEAPVAWCERKPTLDVARLTSCAYSSHIPNLRFAPLGERVLIHQQVMHALACSSSWARIRLSNVRVVGSNHVPVRFDGDALGDETEASSRWSIHKAPDQCRDLFSSGV